MKVINELWLRCMFLRFRIVFFSLSALGLFFAPYAQSTQEAAFIVDVPFYCPPPSVKSVESLIQMEDRAFEKKCKKRPEKLAHHEVYKFNNDDFTLGHEPYRIAGIKKDGKVEKDGKFRGFLKLYKEGNKVKIAKKPENCPGLRDEEAHINQYIHLFHEEAFGSTAIESQERFQQSMRMVLLLNRYKSISSTLNKSLKRYTDELDKNPNVLILRGFWEPKWKKKVKGKWESVTFQEVRHFFIEYLKRDKAAALKFLIENEGGEIDGKQHGRLKGFFQGVEDKSLSFNTHVPYRELREAIRTHPLKQEMVKELRKKNSNKLIYEAIHDSDIVGLRTTIDGSDPDQKIGLYTYYERLIAQNDQPIMLTTGYRATKDERFKELEEKYGYSKEDDYFVSIFAGIEEDRYTRAAFARIDPRLTYYPEPNIIIKINIDEIKAPYSFLKREGSWSLDCKPCFRKYKHPRESLNILSKIYEKHTDKRPNVIFDPKHPILMKLAGRMLYNKHIGTPFKVGVWDPRLLKIVPHKKSDCSFLKTSENISQSCLNFHDSVPVIYAQLNLKGKKFNYKDAQISYPNTLFTSIVTNLFNIFDPIHMIEELGNSSTAEERIYYICNNYYELLNKRPLSEVISIKMSQNATLEKDFKAALSRQKDMNEQLKVLRAYFNPIFQYEQLNAPIDMLIEAAKTMGAQRLDIIKTYYASGFKSNANYPELGRILAIEKSRVEQAPPRNLDTQNTPQDPFQQFSVSKLKILVKALEAHKPSKLSVTNFELSIANFCGYKSRTPIKNLLEKGTHNCKEPQKIWDKLTKELASFCTLQEIDVTKIIKSVEDYARRKEEAE